MKNNIVLQTNGGFFITIHAAPNLFGEFQWYCMDDPNQDSKANIERQIYESITLSSEDIKKNYMNKWLACHCEVKGEQYDEGCVYLTDDFIEIIKSNQFDAISFTGEDGNIREDICYGPKTIPVSRNLKYMNQNKKKGKCDN